MFWQCNSGTCGFYKVVIILSPHTWYLIKMIKVILSGNFLLCIQRNPYSFFHFSFILHVFSKSSSMTTCSIIYALLSKECVYDMLHNVCTICEMRKELKIQLFRFDSVFSLELLKLLDYQTLWARCQTFKTLTSFQLFKHTFWTGRRVKHTQLLIFTIFSEIRIDVKYQVDHGNFFDYMRPF